MNTKIADKAIVLVSGGQDSTTCLYWAKKYFNEVQAVSFFYNQRHSIELQKSNEICKLAKVEQKTIDVTFINKLGGSALLNKEEEIKEGDRGLPTSFVPCRNVYFLSITASLAYQEKISHIVTGVCQSDFSGYCDCRDKSIKALQVALTECLGYDIYIHTPLMWLNKSQTWQLAEELNCLEVVQKYSHTCYNGIEGGCHECPACKLREKGFVEYLKSKE